MYLCMWTFEQLPLIVLGFKVMDIPSSLTQWLAWYLGGGASSSRVFQSTAEGQGMKSDAAV